MPGREREIWFDKLGIAGIRRDILQEKSDETVLFECHNLDPSLVQGSIRKVPGQPASILSHWASSSGYYPGILNVGLWSMGDTDYVLGVGHVSPSVVPGMQMYFEEATTGGHTVTPVAMFDCPNWKLLSPPTFFMDRMFTPRGDTVPPVITEHVEVSVPADADLDHDGVVHREAKTGFPFCGFIIDNGTSYEWHPPFVSYSGTQSAHVTYMAATGWGLVGTAYNATDGNVAGPNSVSPADGFIEFDILPVDGLGAYDPDMPWLYGYAHYGDDYAVGWGVKYSGSNESRLYLRKVAVGYVYVYSDGTTSEMMVMKYDNDALGTDWALGGTAKTRVPVNMCVNSAAAGPATIDTNYCAIAWKFFCRLPKATLLDHAVVGVRVFYSHWSTQEGDVFPYDWALGYKGWDTDYDIFGGMREVMYLDDEDAKFGYCRVESATVTVVSEGVVSTEMVNFSSVLCPCEASVAQITEVNTGSRNIVVNKPMTLGRLWSEIKGDAYTDTGVLVDVGADTSGVTVKLIENGKLIRSYNYDLANNEEVDPEANYLTEVMPQTAVLSHGCVAQAGRLFHWGVKLTSERETNWTTIYPTHIDQDSISWPTIIRPDLAVPIRLGEIRAAVSVGRDIVVGTTRGIAIMSFGGGQVVEWSRRVLDGDIGVGCPGAIRDIGDMCIIVGMNGHIYLYRDGSQGLDDLSAPLFTPDTSDIILPVWARTDDMDYPNDHVFNNVAIAYSAKEHRAVISYHFDWFNVKTVCYDFKTGTLFTMSRSFIGASAVAGDTPYVTTGNAVVGLWDYTVSYLEASPSTAPSSVVALYGNITDEVAPVVESITQHYIEDRDILNLASAPWADKGYIRVGWSAERIREALGGLPPGGSLFYHSNGWKNIDTYDPDVGSAGYIGRMTVSEDLYDTGGKFSVLPDLWWAVKYVPLGSVNGSIAWKLSFEKFITSPGRQHLLSMFMLKADIGDTFTVKFYPDGSSTAHTTLTIAGVVKQKFCRIRVPARHSVRIVMESSAPVAASAFELRRVGLVVREGGRLG